MKLNLIFIVMDALTLLAFPILSVYGKINSFSRSKEMITPADLLVTVPVASVDT